MVAPLSNPATPNPNTLMADLRMKSDKQLFDYAQMHKNDPYIFPMAFQESNARKKLRAAAQNTQTPPAPKVVDQSLQEMAQPMPEDQGIAMLPAPNMQNMAGGGIVAFDDGGEVPGYAGGVFTKTDRKQEFAAKYRDAAVLAGQELGVDPGIIISQWGLETGWGKSIIPNTNNLGNIKDFSGKGVKAYDKAEKSNDRYRQYESPEAFAKDYVSLIKRKYPDSVGTGGDAKKFVAGLRPGEKGGYATDEKYGSKFLNTVSSFLPIATATAPGIDKATVKPTLTNPAIDQIPGQSVKAPPPKAASQDQGLAALAGGDPMTGFTMPQDVFSPSPEEERKYAAAKVKAKKVEDVVSQIPGQSVKAPAFKDTNTYFGGVADEMGISPEVQRNVSNTINATSGFTSPLSGVNRAASTVSKGLEPTAEMIQKAAQAKQIAETPRLLPPAKAGLEGLDAASAAARAGAEQARRMRLLEQDRKAAVGAEQSIDAATKSAAIADKLAKEQAMLVDAARLNQVKMTGAAQGLAMTQAADKAGLIPQGGGVSDLVSNERIGESVFDPTFGGKMPLPVDKAAPEGITAAETPKDPVTGGTDWNKLMLQMGLHLMAGKSPNLLTNVGEAGLGALTMQQAEAKANSEKAYREAMAAHAKMPSSEVQMIERYSKDPTFRKAVDTMAAAKREPMTRETLFKEYIKSPVASIKPFSEYVSEYEKEFGPLGAGVPTGVIVSRAGQT